MSSEFEYRDDQPQFDEWAIVELMGHQKMAGHVTQAPIGDFLRVDVYDATGDEVEILYTRLINPKAIYAINPVSREVALAVGKQFAKPPVARWEMRALLPPRDEVPVGPDEDDWGDDEDWGGPAF